MPLTGRLLLLLLLVAGVVTPVATLLLWHRVRGPRAARIAQRAALLLVSQLSAVLLVAVSLNDYGNFYPSWASLFAGQPSGVQVSAHGAGTGPAAPGAGVRHLSDPTTSAAAQWPTTGRLESIQVSGAVSRLSQQAYVYLPPEYFQPTFQHSRFPAVEVFSDFPGTDQQLIGGTTGTGYVAALQALLHQHQASPTVLVLIRPAVSYPRDTECTDVPSGPQAQTFYALDLPAQLGATYRILPTGWAALGTGTGGYCAAKLALTHSNAFRAAVAINAYFTTRKNVATGELWGGSVPLRNLNDLQWRLEHQPLPPVSILAMSNYSLTGPDGYRGTQAFAALARPPLQITTQIETTAPRTAAAKQVDEQNALGWLIARLPVPVSA